MILCANALYASVPCIVHERETNGMDKFSAERIEEQEVLRSKS